MPFRAEASWNLSSLRLLFSRIRVFFASFEFGSPALCFRALRFSSRRIGSVRIAKAL
jgi:hypothetical protein